MLKRKITTVNDFYVVDIDSKPLSTIDIKFNNEYLLLNRIENPTKEQLSLPRLESNYCLAVSLYFFEKRDLKTAKQFLFSATEPVLNSRFKLVQNEEETLCAIDHISAYLNKRKPTIPYIKRYGQSPSCDVRTFFKLLKKFNAYINEKDLNLNYKRKTPKSLEGTLDINGNFLPCFVETRSYDEWSKLTNFHSSKMNAEVYFTIKSNCYLYDKEQNKEIKQIGPHTLNLPQFRSYLLVDDISQSYRVKNLLIRVDYKYYEDFEKETGLCHDKWVEGENTDYFTYEVNIEDLPFATKIDIDVQKSAPKNLLTLTAIKKFLNGYLVNAHFKSLDEATIEDLKKYYIFGNRFNPPLVGDSDVDKFEVPKYVFGSSELDLVTSQLPSGNKYLQRRFEYDGESDFKLEYLHHPQFDQNKLKVKTLTSKHRITKLDTFLFPIFSQLLGFEEIKDPYLLKIRRAVIDRDIAQLELIQDQVNFRLDQLYEDTFIPIILNLSLDYKNRTKEVHDFLSKFEEVSEGKYKNGDYLYELKEKVISHYVEKE